MNRWITIMAGGPQDGEQFPRDFYEPRATPPALRAADGRVCCPVATHIDTTHARCVVVHPEATEAQIERAVDTMLEGETGPSDRV
jgi:hypothetical protein